MMTMVKNFLQNFSNRELAIAIWIFIAIIWAFSQSSVRNSLFQLIKAFFVWKLALSYLLMSLYITLIIIPLNMVGIWQVAYFPVTILWILCVAFVMLFEFSKANDRNFFKNAIKDNIKGLIILEFIINLYVFDLWIELLLVPIFGIIGGMMAIAETDEKYEVVKKLLNSIMVLFGLLSIIYATYMVATDLKNFATLDNFSNFYLPILLSIMFLPFIYFTALYAGYESLFTRLQFFVEDSAVLTYAKKKTIFAFNLNLWELNKWAEHINTSWRFKAKKEVDEAIQKFKSITS